MHKKIDIFSRKDSNTLVYLCSTNQSKTCKEAIERYRLRASLSPEVKLRAFFASKG